MAGMVLRGLMVIRGNEAGNVFGGGIAQKPRVECPLGEKISELIFSPIGHPH
jgi:hypothetical protein